MNDEKIDEIIAALQELKDDPAINKNIKERVDKIVSFLKADHQLGIDKALLEFEDIMEKNDLQPYTRTQIWNVVSLLESNCS